VPGGQQDCGNVLLVPCAPVFAGALPCHAAADAKPFRRGINSFQPMFDGHRWWVVTIYWQGERPDQPIPTQYGG
jgi:hypothetical protein